ACGGGGGGRGFWCAGERGEASGHLPGRFGAALKIGQVVHGQFLALQLGGAVDELVGGDQCSGDGAVAVGVPVAARQLLQGGGDAGEDLGLFAVDLAGGHGALPFSLSRPETMSSRTGRSQWGPKTATMAATSASWSALACATLSVLRSLVVPRA